MLPASLHQLYERGRVQVGRPLGKLGPSEKVSGNPHDHLREEGGGWPAGGKGVNVRWRSGARGGRSSYGEGEFDMQSENEDGERRRGWRCR